MHIRPLALLLATASALVIAAPGRSPTPAGSPRTYCNPLPIPDYPVGRNVRGLRNGDKTDGSFLWFVDHVEQYRELADIDGALARGRVEPVPVGGHGVGEQGRRGDLAAPPAQRPRPRLRADGGAQGNVPADGVRVADLRRGLAARAVQGTRRPKLPTGVPEQIDPMLFSTTTAGCSTTGAAPRRRGSSAWNWTGPTPRAWSASR